MSLLLYHGFHTSTTDDIVLQHFHTTLLDETQLFLTFALSDYFDERDGGLLFDTIRNTAFDYLIAAKDLPSYDRFEEMLKHVNDGLKMFMSHKQDGYAGDMHATIGFLSGEEFHVSKVGLAQCFLLRKGELVDISEGLYDPSTDTGEFFVNIASGVLKKHDKVIYATRPLLRYINAQEVVSIFATTDVEGSLVELESALLKNHSGPCAVSAFCLLKEPHRASVLVVREAGVQVAYGEGRAPWPKAAIKMVRGMLHKEDTRKMVIIGAVVLVVVLLVSLFTTMGSRKNSELLEQYGRVLQEAEQQINAARTEATSNNTERAKHLLGDARSKLHSLRDDRVFIEDVDSLLATIAHEEAQMDNINLMEDPRVFAELSQYLQGEEIKDVITSNAGMYVYTERSVIGPILDGHTTSFTRERIPDGNVILSGDYFGDRNELIFLVSPNKIAEFANGAFAFIDTTDALWKNAMDIRTFAERDFVYLLDHVENQIWRYRRMNTNYGAASGWLTQQSDRELIDSDVVSFAIDGFIFVLKRDGSMYKFYDGRRSEPFMYADLPSEPLTDLDSNSRLFVRQGQRHIYVLDHGRSRILVFRKDPVLDVRLLRYDRQFTFPGRDIRGITVDKDEITMYVTDSTTIYKIDL